MKTLNYFITYVIIILFLSVVGFGLYKMYQLGLSMTLIAVLVVYFVNLITTTYIIVQTRHAQAKLAWLMVMGLLPMIGHVLFYLFGLKYKSRIQNKDYKNQKYFAYEQADKDVLISQENKHLFHKQVAMSHRGVYRGKVEFYKSGHDAIEKLFSDLEKAKRFIYLHYYIIKPGEIYDHLKTILIKKAKAGVDINFIIDDFGRWAMPWYEIKELQAVGIKIKVFGKVHFPFIGSNNGVRTHRKQVIIDGEIAHFGGINIADEYANLNSKYGVWIDCQARITGKLVHSHNLLFMQDWNNLAQESEHIKFETFPVLKNEGNTTGILVEDGPENVESIMQDTICRLILNAKEEISIATPYLVPTQEIFSALRSAAMSGVKVNIFIPGKPDKKTVFATTIYYAERLQKYGVNVYEANDMLIHSKVAIFDNSYAYFGTPNIDYRSLYSQMEILQLIEGQAIQQVKDLFKYYKSFSTPLKPHQEVSKRIKIIQRVFVNIFSPLM